MDKIIVKRNFDMEKIIEWAKPLKSQIVQERETFIPPYAEIAIEFKEEMLYCEYRYNAPVLEMKFFALKEDDNTWLPVAKQQYDFVSDRSISQKTFVQQGGGYDKRKEMMEFLLTHDKTFTKLGTKWFYLMVFASHYKKEIESTKRTTAKVCKKKQKHKSKTKKLYTTVYTIQSDSLAGIKHARRKIDHEFGVRGHYRHMKSGKVIWVKEYQKCKGRGKVEQKTMIAKM